MRRVAKSDENQKALDKAARSVGALVLPLHQLGGGVPDRLMLYRGVLTLVEYKSPTKTSHRRPKQLTPDQEKFFQLWGEAICIVENEDELLRAIGAII